MKSPSREAVERAREVLNFSVATAKKKGHKEKCECWWCSMVVKLAQALDLARSEAFEEAAKIAETLVEVDTFGITNKIKMFKNATAIAIAIRAHAKKKGEG